MDRFQTVNGDKGTIAMHPTGTVDLKPPDFDGSDAANSPESRAFPMFAAGHGACLYLGTRGERCIRRALASGFCAKHSSVGVTPRENSRTSAAEPELLFEDPRKRALKVVIAVVGLAFFLGPIIVDAARAFLAMLRNN